MGSPAERGEQLVIELAVQDLDKSLRLYMQLGFSVERRDRHFAALRYDDRRLFLEERVDLPPHEGRSRANVRVVVADVDALWRLVGGLGLTIEQAIGDRYYGLRDFTIRDPDGHGLRFAAPLPHTGAPAAP